MITTTLLFLCTQLECQGRNVYVSKIIPGVLTTTSYHGKKFTKSEIISKMIPEICSFSKCDFEKPMSMPWVKSKIKVTQGKHHPVDSYPLCFILINQTINFSNIAISKFENPKAQCQDHGWGQNLKIMVGSTYYSCQSVHHFLRY